MTQGRTSRNGDDVAGGEGGGELDQVPVGALSYAAASAELDEIVDELDRGHVDVDRLVGQLERATAIVDELDRRITATRVKVEELAPRLERAGRNSATGVGEMGGETDRDDPE